MKKYDSKRDAYNYWNFIYDHNTTYTNWRGFEMKELIDMLYEFSGWMPKKIIHNDNATIVIWSDGDKTVIKGHGDDIYAAFCICVAKRFYGNTTTLNRMFDNAELSLKDDR